MAAAQQREWRLQAQATVAPAGSFAGAGGGLLVRPQSRVGWALQLAAGLRNGTAAVRGEALLSLPLDPFRDRGLVPYAAGGLALLLQPAQARGYLLGLLGVAANPGADRGWFFEAGLGGGWRVAAGIAFRRVAR